MTLLSLQEEARKKFLKYCAYGVECKGCTEDKELLDGIVLCAYLAGLEAAKGAVFYESDCCDSIDTLIEEAKKMV